MRAVPYPEQITTPRLRLRRLRESDRAGMADVWSDPPVWRSLRPDLPPLSPGIIDAAIDRHIAHWEQHGFGLWLVELRDAPGEAAGWIGASHPSFVPGMAEQVEIGWTLHSRHWGRGYAGEGARRACHAAFESLACESVVSLIHRSNRRSIAVAERLGMRRAGEVQHAGAGLRLGVYELAESASNSRFTPGSSPGDGA